MYPLHKTGLKTDIQPVNSGQIDQPRPQQDTSFDITASSEHNVDLTYVKLKNINIKFYFCFVNCFQNERQHFVHFSFPVFAIIDTKTRNALFVSCQHHVGNTCDSLELVKVGSGTILFLLCWVCIQRTNLLCF